MSVTAEIIRPGNPEEIQEIYVLYESPDVVLIHIITTSKYPKIVLTGARSIIFESSAEVRFANLPFKNSYICNEPGRYTTTITLFNFDLYDTLSQNTCIFYSEKENDND